MVWKLLKNAKLYNPERIDDTDVLIVGRSIAALGRNFQLPDYVKGEVVDLQGKTLVPGFIDAHVHICGGGGEAGPASRTPEIQTFSINSRRNDNRRGLFGDRFRIQVYV